MWEWVWSHQDVVAWLGVLSLVTFVGSLIVIPILVVRIPTDYFLHLKPPPDSWRGRHPALRLSALFLKNVFGIIFVAAGIAMLVLPGQGILTILIGMTLLNFPGKRRLELRIIRQPTVLRAVNWTRTKSQRPPLQVAERVWSATERGQP